MSKTVSIHEGVPVHLDDCLAAVRTLDLGSLVTRRHLGGESDLGSFIATTFGVELPPGYRFELDEAGVQVQTV